MTIVTDVGLTTPTLATVAQLQRRYPEVVDGIDPDTLQEILEESTRHLESRTGRRLAPFIGHVYQNRMFGIDPEEYGADAGMPMSFAGSLGMNLAYSLGSNNLVRHEWLDHFAPMFPEFWTYNIQSIQIYRTWGDSQPITSYLGPDSTDGHIWFQIGTLAPAGTRIQIIYDGGYTLGTPADLRRACLFQAIKFIILEAEPQNRKDVNLDEIDAQISMLIGPWVRG